MKLSVAYVVIIEKFCLVSLIVNLIANVEISLMFYQFVSVKVV